MKKLIKYSVFFIIFSLINYLNCEIINDGSSEYLITIDGQRRVFGLPQQQMILRQRSSANDQKQSGVRRDNYGPYDNSGQLVNTGMPSNNYVVPGDTQIGGHNPNGNPNFPGNYGAPNYGSYNPSLGTTDSMGYHGVPNYPVGNNNPPLGNFGNSPGNYPHSITQHGPYGTSVIYFNDNYGQFPTNHLPSGHHQAHIVQSVLPLHFFLKHPLFNHLISNSVSVGK